MGLKEQVNYYMLLCQGRGIEVPQYMLWRIVDFAMGEFAERILMALDGKLLSGKWKENDELKEIKNVLEKQSHRKLGVKIQEGKNESRMYLRFNFEGWNTPIGDVEKIYEALEKIGKKGIVVEVKFYGGNNGVAFWTPRNMTLTLHLIVPALNEVGDFKRAIMKMGALESIVQDTVSHELKHMVQGIGGITMELKEPFGLPPKTVRKKNVDPYGNIWGKGNEIEGEMPHESRDIEFYTNLEDAVGIYNYLIKKVPEELKKEFVKIFIGTGTEEEKTKFIEAVKAFPKIMNKGEGYWWFVNLKRRDEERWKLAVKRFMGMIGTI